MNGKMVTIDEWAKAFSKAEEETANHFNHTLCAMTNVDGKYECPLCYLSKCLKSHLGIE